MKPHAIDVRERLMDLRRRSRYEGRGQGVLFQLVPIRPLKQWKREHGRTEPKSLLNR